MGTRVMRSLIVICIIILFSATVSVAGLMDTLGLGSKATALGGAYAAYADDPFAVYYNPAGLTQIEKKTVSMGGHSAFASIKIHDFHLTPGIAREKDRNGNIKTIKELSAPPFPEYVDITNRRKLLPAPHMACANPITDRIVFGFGFYAPFGAEAAWNDRQSENPGAYNSSSGSFMRLAATPTIAYQVTDKLSIGVGLSIGASMSKVEKNMYMPDVIVEALKDLENSLNTQPELRNTRPHLKVQSAIESYQQKIIGELYDPFNYSYNLGLMYKPTETVTFGITYRSRSAVDFKGKIQIEGVQERPNVPVKVDAETSIDHPAQLQVGVRCQASERLSIEFDYMWTRWGFLEDYVVNLDPEILGSRADDIYMKELENTSQIRMGLEYKSDEFITLRLGYYYDPTPVPDDGFEIGWSDINKTVYSFGVGVKCPNLSDGKLHRLISGNVTIDGVFQFITSPEKRRVGYDGRGSLALNDSYNFRYDPDLRWEAIDNVVSLEASMNVWALGVTMNCTF